MHCLSPLRSNRCRSGGNRFQDAGWGMRTLIDETAAGATYSRSVTSTSTNGAAGQEPSNGLMRRLVERFALIAFGLYHVPLFLNNYPSLGGGGMSETGLAISWGRVFTPPGIWVAHHVFHIAGPMPNGYRGDNGDVAEEFGGCCSRSASRRSRRCVGHGPIVESQADAGSRMRS